MHLPIIVHIYLNIAACSSTFLSYFPKLLKVGADVLELPHSNMSKVNLNLVRTLLTLTLSEVN